MEAMAVVRAEVGTCIAALARNAAPPILPQVQLEYIDFALWEHSHAVAATHSLDWWLSHLEGAPELLALPIDKPRPVMQNTPGIHVDVHFGSYLTERVLAMCVEAGVTLNNFLLTIWGALLMHLSSQGDFVVGIPHSLR